MGILESLLNLPRLTTIDLTNNNLTVIQLLCRIVLSLIYVIIYRKEEEINYANLYLRII